MTTGKWGPDGKPMAACVTFDHLGEATELGQGTWPAEAVVGRHHSVSAELPALLEMLTGRVAATFYVEAWNFGVYPDALRSIVDAGHDIGWHGWLHEPWYKTSGPDLRRALEKSMEAYDRAGIRPVGARPPAGLLGRHSLQLLRDFGFPFVSLAGATYGIEDGTALLPYPVTAIDGVYYQRAFTRMRKEQPGDEVVGPEVLLRAHSKFVDETARAGGFASFVFHVPWQDTPEKVAAIGVLMDRLDQDDRVWHASSADVAAWMREHPDSFPRSTHVDEPPPW